MAARTGMNEGFILDSTGSESMACKISQFIMQLIVVGKDKTTKTAGKAMIYYMVPGTRY